MVEEIHKGNPDVRRGLGESLQADHELSIAVARGDARLVTGVGQPGVDEEPGLHVSLEEMAGYGSSGADTEFEVVRRLLAKGVDGQEDGHLVVSGVFEKLQLECPTAGTGLPVDAAKAVAGNVLPDSHES